MLKKVPRHFCDTQGPFCAEKGLPETGKNSEGASVTAVTLEISASTPRLICVVGRSIKFRERIEERKRLLWTTDSPHVLLENFCFVCLGQIITGCISICISLCISQVNHTNVSRTEYTVQQSCQQHNEEGRAHVNYSQ